MKFRKVGMGLFIFLIIYWIFVIFLAVFLISLGIALLFYFKNDNTLYFDWIKESIYAIKKAVIGGSVLGIGIWVKARLQARKDKKELTE